MKGLIGYLFLVLFLKNFKCKFFKYIFLNLLIIEGSTEETETSSIIGAKPYNRLGEDLLRMFLEEINPDVTIDVAGRLIRAHKCILSSRCQYFAAMLSGGWIESAGNVISLPGYAKKIYKNFIIF